MFQINCLNPISKVGLDRLTADYKVPHNRNRSIQYARCQRQWRKGTGDRWYAVSCP